MSKKTLRQRVSGYFRQLSFINEPRVQISSNREENFIRKYLDGRFPERIPIPIHSGRDPQDMPDVEVKCGGDATPLLAFTGPEEGLAAIVRSKLHLSAGSDIDFIDNNNLESDFEVRRSKRGNAPRFGGIIAGPGESRFGNANVSRKSEPKEPSPPPSDNNGSKIALNPGGDVPNDFNSIAGISNWDSDSDYVCGLSTTLYERNPVSLEVTGSPIADCFAFIAHGDVCLLGLADGVNWGEKACLAARAALRGSLEYLKSAVFGLGGNSSTRNLSSREIFVSLLRSIWEAHGCILEVGGALTTLTLAVVVPVLATADHDNRKWIVCACNVGDSLGFVYSPKYGVREFTEASHDTTSMRDMRDALGALGPVDGTKPELSNLTLSLTEVEEGDFVFLTSDGISDNFDPVVGKFAMAVSDSPDLADVKTELKVAGSGRSMGNSRTQLQGNKSSTSSAATSSHRPKSQPLASLTNRSRPTPEPTANRPQYNRSRTVIEPTRRNLSHSNPFGSPSATPIHRSPSILPQVTGAQRHKLTLLRLEDMLSYGINGTLQPCNSTRQLCKLLIDFSKMITAAKRSMLEQRETYVRLVTDPGGQRREAELNRLQMRAARKRIVDSSAFQALPGKLDHATVVGFMCRTSNRHSSQAQVVVDELEKPALAVIAPRSSAGAVIVTDF